MGTTMTSSRRHVKSWMTSSCRPMASSLARSVTARAPSPSESPPDHGLECGFEPRTGPRSMIVWTFSAPSPAPKPLERHDHVTLSWAGKVLPIMGGADGSGPGTCSGRTVWGSSALRSWCESAGARPVTPREQRSPPPTDVAAARTIRWIMKLATPEPADHDDNFMIAQGGGRERGGRAWLGASAYALGDMRLGPGRPSSR
jgi:hypothetical protein